MSYQLSENISFSSKVFVIFIVFCNRHLTKIFLLSCYKDSKNGSEMTLSKRDATTKGNKRVPAINSYDTHREKSNINIAFPSVNTIDKTVTIVKRKCRKTAKQFIMEMSKA